MGSRPFYLKKRQQVQATAAKKDAVWKPNHAEQNDGNSEEGLKQFRPNLFE